MGDGLEAVSGGSWVVGLIGFGGGDRQIATPRHCFTADYTDSTRMCSGLTTRYGASSTDPGFVVEQRKANGSTQTILGVRVRELLRVVFRVNLWSCCCDLAESRAGRSVIKATL